MTEMNARYRIGFDIGGTFTDFILLDEERSEIRLHKCLTTPADPSIGALAGLAELVEAAGIRLSEVGEIVHGTTLVTNALIERRGAKLGLITTEGFRDILEMGRCRSAWIATAGRSPPSISRRCARPRGA